MNIKEKLPLNELIDHIRDGIDEVFVEQGYPNVTFVLVVQDNDSGEGGMSAVVDLAGSVALLEIALEQSKKRKEVMQ